MQVTYNFETCLSHVQIHQKPKCLSATSLDNTFYASILTSKSQQLVQVQLFVFDCQKLIIKIKNYKLFYI